MPKNFLNRMMILTANAMKTTDWKWPKDWTKEQKIKFLDDIIEFLEQEGELYEYCSFFKDVKKEIQS